MIKTKIFAFYLLCLLAMILSSCCVSQKTAERKISRLVECNPSLRSGKADTISVRIVDTVFTEKRVIMRDTVLTFDTLLIEQDGGFIEVIRERTGSPCDSVMIPIKVRAECPPDTIKIDQIIEVPIMTDQINVTDKRGGSLMSKIGLFAIGVIFGIIFVLIAKQRF